MTITREGVVARVSESNGMWTEENYSLGPADATIQLLDRPKPTKPVSVLPTKVGAIVRYTVDFDATFPLRTAFRSKSGVWVCYNEEGDEQDKHFSDAIFADFLADSRFTPEVLFAGVSK
jgi:hypothetical protein